MILYIVNVTIEKNIQEEWLNWMRKVHIPNVLKTGYFTGAQIFSMILPAKSGTEISFSVHYEAESYEKFMSYTVKESKRLQKEHTDKFNGKIKAERFVMEKL